MNRGRRNGRRVIGGCTGYPHRGEQKDRDDTRRSARCGASQAAPRVHAVAAGLLKKIQSSPLLRTIARRPFSALE